MLSFAPFISIEIAVLVLAAMVIILAGLVVYLAIKLSRLTRGASGTSLEAIIAELHTGQQLHQKHIHALQETTAGHHARLSHTIRGVSTIRFDPFQNAGQQSFATALLNESGNGVVISGIHARDGVRVYAKEVQNFVSERELSESETEAILAARTKL
ncbi:MAG: hypothetical protein RLZZ283_535 [Candidatus Parcubacteria bacterium]